MISLALALRVWSRAAARTAAAALLAPADLLALEHHPEELVRVDGVAGAADNALVNLYPAGVRPYESAAVRLQAGELVNHVPGRCAGRGSMRYPLEGAAKQSAPLAQRGR
jgi:hypothetical protein